MTPEENQTFGEQYFLELLTKLGVKRLPIPDEIPPVHDSPANGVDL